MSGKISKFSNPVVIKDVDCKGVDVVALVKHTIDKKCASFAVSYTHLTLPTIA